MTARRAGFLSFWIGLVMLAVGAIGDAWWTINHNDLNVNCANFIYLDHHRHSCDAWMLHNGIVNGITIPLICIGFCGVFAGGAIWLFQRFDA